MDTNEQMNPELQKVCDKVKKLLALSQNNTSVEEAHAAAAAATRIMQEYRITQAMLEAQGSVQSEPFVRKVVSEGGRRTAWREVVLHALCDHYGCIFYFSSYRVGGIRSQGAPGSKGRQSYTVVGRKSDVDIVDYMFAWSTHEVERLCRYHAGGEGVKYALAWMMGCARGLASQFYDMKAALRAQAQAQVGAGASTALAVLDKRAEDTRAYADKNLNLSKGTVVHGAHDYVASAKGYEVGRSMQIKKGIGSGGSSPAGALGSA